MRSGGRELGSTAGQGPLKECRWSLSPSSLSGPSRIPQPRYRWDVVVYFRCRWLVCPQQPSTSLPLRLSLRHPSAVWTRAKPAEPLFVLRSRSLFLVTVSLTAAAHSPPYTRKTSRRGPHREFLFIHFFFFYFITTIFTRALKRVLRPNKRTRMRAHNTFSSTIVQVVASGAVRRNASDPLEIFFFQLIFNVVKEMRSLWKWYPLKVLERGRSVLFEVLFCRQVTIKNSWTFRKTGKSSLCPCFFLFITTYLEIVLWKTIFEIDTHC